MSDLIDLGALPFHRLLPERLRQTLRDSAVNRRYGDGELIHARGDRRPGLSIVRTGAVRLCNVGSDGSTVTTAVLGPGQAFGEFSVVADLPRTHDAIAVGITSVDQVGSEPFRRLLEREPALARILLEATVRRLHAVLELLDDLRRLPPPVLAAKLLLSMLESSAGPDVVNCSQTDLAYTLGVSRVTVGKVLAGLEAEGLLERGYGRIRIPEPDRLRDWVSARTALLPLEA